MYTPSFKTKKNGVPVLDRKEIDNIGENFIRDFQPSVLTSPAPVDIENFTEFYLGMTPDYTFEKIGDLMCADRTTAFRWYCKALTHVKVPENPIVI